jgi:hypothetical protein
MDIHFLTLILACNAMTLGQGFLFANRYLCFHSVEKLHEGRHIKSGERLCTAMALSLGSGEFQNHFKANAKL